MSNLKEMTLGLSKSSFGKREYELMRAWVLGLEGVTEAPHRFGGTEFQAHGFQFMHSHGYAQFDIRLSKEDQARVLREGKALEHRYAPETGWVTFIAGSQADVAQAKEIIELSHKNAERTMSAIEARRSMQGTKELTH